MDNQPIQWQCQHCSKQFEFTSARQKGGHLTNCKSNPQRQAIIAKQIAANTKPILDFVFQCEKCGCDKLVKITQADIDAHRYGRFCSRACANSHQPTAAHKAKVATTMLAKSGKSLALKDKAIQLRSEGHGISNIAKNLGVNVPLISKWVTDVIVTDPIKAKQFQRNNWKKALAVYRLNKIDRYLLWKKEAEELFNANQHDRLFNVGIGLYWGEGSKTKGQFSLSNADPRLSKVWKEWIVKFTTIRNIRYDIYAHNDVIESDAINYWRSELNLSESDKIVLYRCNPKSSQNLQPGKCKFGTVRISGGVGAIEWHTKMIHMFELITQSAGLV